MAFIFRVDASHDIGLGHLMRCIAFSAYLEPHGQSYFVMRAHDNSQKIASLISSKNTLIMLAPDMTVAEEVDQIGMLVKKSKAWFLLTDLCHQETLNNPSSLIEYHEKLKKIDHLFVMSIEDCRFTHFSSHAVVLYNALTQDAQKDALKKILILQGTQYFICHPDLARGAQIKRPIRKKAKRVLICLGGSDLCELTYKIINALKYLSHLEVKVVIGPAFDLEYQQKIEQFIQQYTHFISLSFSNHWHAHLLWADIVIVGEGIVKFDAVLTGAPSIMISQFDHDSKPIQEFLSLDVVHYLGRGQALSAKMIAETIVKLLDNYDERYRLSKRSKGHFDSNGVKNICQQISLTHPKMKEVVNAMA